jgi:predicted secreted acid phosphatase
MAINSISGSLLSQSTLRANSSNTSNYSSGYWNSEWTLNTAESKVDGAVRLFAYLHEESNNLFFNDERTE